MSREQIIAYIMGSKATNLGNVGIAVIQAGYRAARAS